MNNFIDWETLKFKKQSGTEKLRCPACDSVRTDKRDKSLQINHNEGFGKCHYCEALTFKNDNETNYSEKEYTKIDFKASINAFNEEKIKTYVLGRKISETTLKALYVTFENYYQPAKQKKMDCIVFNYYEGSKLVNKKFRSGGKDFTQISGAKPIFYNINSVIGQKEVYIVEGEFDVLAMYEHGIKNVISVPNGANDNDEYWKNSEKYLKDIEKFIIAVDNDEKGNDLKEKIAQRLGRYRCEYLEWQNKDANGDLIDGCIEDTLQNRKSFPVSGTFTVSDLYEGIINLYDNGLPDTITPSDNCFKGLKNVFTVMRGQLTTVTGIPSHGKSNFVDWYVLNLIKDYGMKASWFSPEHSPMELYHTNLSEKVIGKSFWGKVQNQKVPRITKQDLEDYKQWANERIYLTDASDGEFPTWDWLFEKFKEQMFQFGIDIFVIDAFNKVLLPKGNKLEQINVTLTKLTSFAQMNNVMIFLVAHPTKMQKNDQGIYGIPTLYDVSGSADFRNQTHNGFTIYRYWENVETGDDDRVEFINMKTKYNFQGNIGEKVVFKYCPLNGRFYSNDVEPTYSFLSKEEPPKIEPEEAFNDEIPF